MAGNYRLLGGSQRPLGASYPGRGWGRLLISWPECASHRPPELVLTACRPIPNSYGVNPIVIARTAASADLLGGRTERRACHRGTVAGAGVIAGVTVRRDGGRLPRDLLHDPLHGGFAGHGMLAAAFPGEVFTSPVLGHTRGATKAINGGAGVVHIVKSFTGDVMDCALAAEDAAATVGAERKLATDPMVIKASPPK